MDKLTSLNFSFDRILLQLVIPGLIAFFPWFLIFINTHPNSKLYFQHNTNITIITLVFVSLIIGIILENIGGRIEISFLDRLNRKDDREHDEIWDKFLQMKYEKDEPIGQRYLRNILFRLKFELSTAVALVPMIIGLGILQCHTPFFENPIYIVMFIYIIPILLILYFLFEAISSSKVLARTRKMLVNKYYV